MADLEQWVNLTVNDEWLGESLTERQRMGEIAPLRIQFAEARRATAYVTKEADANNAVYSDTEKPRRLGFHVRDYSRRRITTNRRGVVDLTIRVSLAGGDKFTIRVEDREGNTLHADNLLTRRKLYFQVIRMTGVTAVSAADVTGMQDEFWNTAENIYIRMIEIPPAAATIPARQNYNDTDNSVSSVVLQQTRAAYDTAKNPYCFAVLVVRRNGIPEDEVLAVPATFDATNSHTLTTTKVLFDIVDPAEEYYTSLVWTPTGGASVNIPKARLTRVGNNDIRIDTTGYTQGAGTLDYSMRVLGINGRGLSLPTNNFTLVASEDAETGAAVPAAEVMAVLVHEIGHKIGMVPGPQGTRVLDEQSTYYDGRGHSGGHCNHGVGLLPTYDVGGINPDCTMFGDTRASLSTFCADCRSSVRKLDLRSRTNVGIRTQF